MQALKAKDNIEDADHLSAKIIKDGDNYTVKIWKNTWISVDGDPYAVFVDDYKSHKSKSLKASKTFLKTSGYERRRSSFGGIFWLRKIKM